ncbi:MAG: hypothetical protein FWD38_09625 [Oscillospiraceae bacterium]|nr:hypothetical protein [Oscillospiraceae bacterium]
MKSKLVNKYKNINIGFGSGFPGSRFKISFRLIFHRFWWRDLRYELIYAWQRAVRGYDNSLTWSLDENIKKYIIIGLLSLAESHMGVPNFDYRGGYEVYANLSSEEADALTESRSKEWKLLLIDLADKFYESLKHEDSQYELNQHEDDWHNSFTTEFIKEADSNYSTMKFVPANGYTQEQYESLSELYRNREDEIYEYKKENEKTAMAKLTEILPYLWD